LPENYIVLCPFSTDKRSKERDFNAEDWNQTLKFLEQKDIKGVVINSGNDIVPKNSYLIDLSNLTKIELIRTIFFKLYNKFKKSILN
jgi:hypothetical protein